jgi:hypothetical protein
VTARCQGSLQDCGEWLPLWRFGSPAEVQADTRSLYQKVRARTIRPLAETGGGHSEARVWMTVLAGGLAYEIGNA